MTIREKIRFMLLDPRPEYVIPPEYREIESIGFTGDQWFDTGLYFNNKIRIELDFTPATNGSTGNQMFLGAYDGTYNCVLAKSNNSFNMVYQHGSMGGGSYTETFNFTQQEYAVRKRIIAVGEESITINGNVRTITSTHNFTCSLTSYFGNVHRSVGSYPAYMTCRKSKWYEDGTTLSRWYIPVRRISDNVGGFYDVVNNTFNPSMTGTDFIKGADI